jgi:hypothetical protein
MKKINCASRFLFVFTFFTFSFLLSGQGKENACTFQYAFLYKKGSGIEGVVDPGNRFADLKTGERIKIYIKPVTRAYIYLYLYNSEKVLSLIFPQDFSFFSDGYKTDIPYFLPSEEKWYRLTGPSGIEEFHLIVSHVRLRDLESLTRRYLSSAGTRAGEAIAGMRQDILDKIKQCENNMYSELYGYNEKPVPFAGVVRTLDDGETLTAREMTVSGIYAKTIRIRH